MTTDMPDLFYTPWQRRQVIAKISEKNGISIPDAAVKFRELEVSSPDKLNELVGRFNEGVTNE